MEESIECKCPRTECPRHGRCEECRTHHAEHKKHPPYCDRAKLRAEKKKEKALGRASKEK